MQVEPSKVNIGGGWKEVLAEEFNQPYFAAIKRGILEARQAGRVVYPPVSHIFHAFNSTPFHEVKAVILGQDPYHNPGQAMGLSFSVPKDVRVPASLKRIYKEIAHDYPSFEMPRHGDLSPWAGQGVLLLNAMLTVEEKKPGSHKKLGWQKFTDAAIRALSEKREGIVFLLWGNFAKEKAALIDGSKHLILSSPHPSPLAGDGFFHNQHFLRTNQFLAQQGKPTIDWQV